MAKNVYILASSPGIVRIEYPDGSKTVSHIFAVDPDTGEYIWKMFDEDGTDMMVAHRKMVEALNDRDQTKREKARERWEKYCVEHDGYWHPFFRKTVNTKTDTGEWT